MNKIILFSNIVILIFITSCEDVVREAGFSKIAKESIYDYLVANKQEFSGFIAILEKTGIDKTLSAYNPDGNGYTLFLPDNNAIENFISESPQYTNLDDLLNNIDFLNVFSRYHILNMSIETNLFPYGAFPEPTLTGDFLTVNVKIGSDVSYFMINNDAPVIRRNLVLSNGYIHILSKVLVPVTLTTYQWLGQNPDCSIFKAAIDATGLRNIFDVNARLDQNGSKAITLLLEPDSIYNKRNIFSFEDLANFISPGNSDYTNSSNPLYNFVSYHALVNARFLDNFQGVITNYSTLSSSPIRINGMGIDIRINTGAETYKSVIINGDTTFINYIGIYYDESNINTTSGAIHFIDQIMRPYSPPRAEVTFQFFEESLINQYNKIPGIYLIEDTSSLSRIKWWGANLSYFKTSDVSELASNRDYLLINGDFTITYRIPAIVQGNYRFILRANSNNRQNAVIEVFIDGKKIGGLVDLTIGNAQYRNITIGNVNFSRFEEHTIKIKSLVPGRFIWDFIRFEPI
jgi:uncharacterized surface protein with fasciclin (FAS1) repeats